MAATSTATATTSAAATVKTASDAKLGTILVAANGKTLYIFDKDTANTSNCSGTCIAKWPALTATGTPTGDGVKGKLATITRADGGTQVTLDGKPLYFYAADTKAGDTNGDGVGGIWHVVTNP